MMSARIGLSISALTCHSPETGNESACGSVPTLWYPMSCSRTGDVSENALDVLRHRALRQPGAESGTAAIVENLGNEAVHPQGNVVTNASDFGELLCRRGRVAPSPRSACRGTPGIRRRTPSSRSRRPEGRSRRSASWRLACDVEPELGHGGDDSGVESLAWGRPGRVDDDAVTSVAPAEWQLPSAIARRCGRRGRELRGVPRSWEPLLCDRPAVRAARNRAPHGEQHFSGLLVPSWMGRAPRSSPRQPRRRGSEPR